MKEASRIFAVAALLFGALTLGAQSAEFEQLESAWNQAHVQGDADALNRLWHDDLTVIVPQMPVMSKDEALRFARSGRMKFQKYETSELKVRTYGSTALVTGRMLRSRTIEGRQVDDDWRFTKTYLHDENGWRVVAFQASETGRK